MERQFESLVNGGAPWVALADSSSARGQTTQAVSNPNRGNPGREAPRTLQQRMVLSKSDHREQVSQQQPSLERLIITDGSTARRQLRT